MGGLAGEEGAQVPGVHPPIPLDRIVPVARKARKHAAELPLVNARPRGEAPVRGRLARMQQEPVSHARARGREGVALAPAGRPEQPGRASQPGTVATSPLPLYWIAKRPPRHSTRSSHSSPPSLTTSG